MPTLNWIGKEKVINHDLEVSYRVLEKKYTFNNEESENMIIHGDNLEALKSLMPQYEGQIGFIYIDPPYNTGNEGWVYNDNVKDPKIQRWLGKVVGGEIDDLSRHDKWLCMMYPRLKLGYKLLSKNGVMFVSIDDNVQPYLKLILAEIFGNNNIEQYIWCLQDKTEGSFVKTAGLTVRKEHEYILACFKSPGKRFKKYLSEREFSDGSYSNPDNDPRGPWFSGNMSRNGIKTTTGSKYYGITNPAGEVFYRNWTLSKEEYEEALKDNRIYFSKGGAGVPRLKIFQENSVELIQSSLFSDVHTSITGKNQLKTLFDGVAPFNFPKPSTLIERLLIIASETNDLCLDFFAGSGTTAQAVINVNKKFNTNRKFIEIEMMDYAETLTAERIKRLSMNEEYNAFCNFSYYELGEQLFIDERINENIDIDKIKDYIFYTSTKSARDNFENENKYLLGIKENTSYYFYFEPNEKCVLDEKFLNSITVKSNDYVIFADSCTLSKEELTDYHITFKKTPRDITRF